MNFYMKLEKIAARNKSLNDWMENLPPEKQEEITLINQVNDYDNKFAFKKLLRLYRGTIENSIKQSKILGVMDYNSAKIHAINEFRNSVRNYDINEKTLPVTHITGTLPRYLQNKKNENMYDIVQKTPDLTGKAGLVNIAVNHLKNELDRDPDNKEVYKFITNVMGKKITELNIRRIRALERSELRGDEIIGFDSSGEGETMKWFDTKSEMKLTGEDIQRNKLLEQKVEIALNDFTRPERKFLRSHLRLGSYKHQPARSLNISAMESGISLYKAKQLIQQLKQKVED